MYTYAETMRTASRRELCILIFVLISFQDFPNGALAKECSSRYTRSDSVSLNEVFRNLYENYNVASVIQCAALCCSHSHCKHIFYNKGLTACSLVGVNPIYGDIPEYMHNFWVFYASDYVLCSYTYVVELNKCITVRDTYASWEDGRQYCQSLGGDILTTPTLAELEYFRNLFFQDYPGREFFLGGQKQSNNEFKWITGGTVLTTLWGSGQPDEYYANENCIIANLPSNLYLNDISCTNIYAYAICDFPLGGT